MTALDRRLEKHIRRHRLLPEPGMALLAVSGGSDSLALLDLLVALAPELDLTLAVAHVDHGIRPGSEAVARAVEDVCRRYEVPFHLARIDLGAGASETQARTARYRELRRLQRETGAAYLVTAHHRDDQVETVLYRVLRGSGVAGLAGIPDRGPLGLVRPLLPFTRGDLHEWLVQRAAEGGWVLPIHDDPANRDERHDRVWLRHTLLPLIRSRFGVAVDARVAGVALGARRNRAAWSALLRSLPDLDVRRTTHGVEVARLPLARYDNVLSEAILRALGREVGCTVGSRGARRLARFAHSGKSGKTLELGGGFEAVLAFDRLLIGRRWRGTPPVRALIQGRQGTLMWGQWEFVWRTQVAGRVMRSGHETWVAPGALTVRAVDAGDRLVPLGGVGSRKVRRILMEARVPFRDRAAHPVLARGGTVLWVPGVCRAQAAVPTAGHEALMIEARWHEDRQGKDG